MDGYSWLIKFIYFNSCNLSCITANKQVEKQMELSNKQLLFEKRIEVYNVVDEIEIICSITLNSKNKLTTENIGVLLRDLTGNEYFEEIYNITSIEVGAES